ncbi:MAG TPA: GDSL-type esterase/lipase family protein [Parcubacteria group bacterium]|nr:GDSL-type esterase/lipase family protein [Parcubacteria group bacterium]
MNEFVKRNIFLTIFVLVVCVFLIFYFVLNKDDYTNYPSNGTDIVAFGDSLIQGVGASSSNKNLVTILSKKIGKPIVNLGVSGNTTADGISRLNEIDRYKPKVVILLLGGNDYLRKVPKETTFNNLGKIIEDIHSRGAVVLLLGVRGGLLKDNFDEDFEILASKYNTAFVSNVLSGLILDKRYMSDEIHPNDMGYEKIAERVYPVLKEILK